MRCLFIGPLGNHAVIGRVAAFAEACDDIILLNGGAHHWTRRAYPVKSLTVHRILEDKWYQKKKRLLNLILEVARLYGVIAEDAALVSGLKSAVEEFKPDFAVLHYGPAALHYLRVVKRSGVRLPVVLIPNLIPSFVNLSGMRRASVKHLVSAIPEHLGYSRWLKSADGIIFASVEMKEYASRKYGAPPGQTCILPDYLPRAWQGSTETRQDCRDLVSGERSVVFLGAPERYGNSIDSIDDQFGELANAKIHVYSGAMSDVVCRTGFGHVYSTFSNEEVFGGRLAEFARQFDAVLITYNARRREERFRTTYPTRFLTALGTGIPIAVRGGIFDACERFVKHYGIGFSYSNAEHLGDYLKDRRKMADFTASANQMRAQFTAEHQSEELRAFLGSLKSSAL